MATSATSETPAELLAPAPAVPSLLSDYATLFKVRISTMVIITAAAGYYLGCLRSGISPFHLGMVEALVGIAIVTCGSSALNQALERHSDTFMRRTANRPMAAGRIGLAHGLLLGFAATFLGALILAYVSNPLTGTLTLLTAIGYVAIYTPLKRISSINTFIGAFPGALPPLIGWTAARGVIEWPGIALFAILFVWQFPHFMAIGWMYREDYARAGIRLTATQEPRRKGGSAHCGAGAHLCRGDGPGQPLAGCTGDHRLPLWRRCDGSLAGVSLVYHSLCGDPARSQHRRLREPYAHALLRASIIYLPLLLAAMMLDAKGRLLF